MRFYDHLVQVGIRTKGEVVDQYIRPGSTHGQNHYFVYRYLDTQGESHEGRVIRNRVDDRFKVGEIIDVVYDPVKPGRHVPFVVTSKIVYQPLKQSFLFSMVAVGITLGLGAVACGKLSAINTLFLKRLFGVGSR